MLEIVLSAVAAKVSEYLVDPAVRQLGYLFNYRANIEDLSQQVEKLRDARARLQHSVDEAIGNGHIIKDDVCKWMKRADGFIQNACKFLEDEKEARKSCFNGLCPNLKSRYQLSREARKKAGVAVEIHGAGQFERVSYRAPLQEIRSAPSEALQSRISTLNDVMEALRDANINRIGVWGMGGVGKSTLVKQVAEQANQEKLFEKVVNVSVLQTPDLERIQGELADLLDMKFEEESEQGRAARLYQRMKKEKTILIILDDLWAELELEKVGIPSPDDHKGCKLVLTSRNKQVLSNEMSTQKDFRVRHLQEDETWILFKNTAGDSIENPELQPIAVDVAKECAGLPIAIVTVAKALKNKNVSIWKDALQQLKSQTSTNITGMETKVYSSLKSSYERLEGDEVKSLCLLCGLFSSYIHIRDLLKYGVGLRLFQGTNTLEEAKNRIDTLVDNLKSSNLLLETGHNAVVRMHDLVRTTARKIASHQHHMFTLQNTTVRVEGWPRIDELQKVTWVSLHDCDICELPEGLVCPKLELFGCYDVNTNSAVQIPNNFFEEMKQLKVLALSRMQLPSLPLSLHCLTNLRTLCLDGCKVEDIDMIAKLKKLEILSLTDSDMEQLPREISQLTHLRLLDLSGSWKLKVIPSDVISSLSQLENLCMANSFTQWEGEGKSNACLAELKHLSHLTSLDIQIPDAKLLPKDIVFDNLVRYRIFVGDVRSWEENFEANSTLKLNKFDTSLHLVDGISKLLKRTEDLHLRELCGGTNVLSKLNREGFLKLKHLNVESSPEIQYIVNSMDLTPSHGAFPVMETLSLNQLINLQEVCRGQFPAGSFGCLRKVEVKRCDGLKFLFSLSVASLLQNLEELIVESCGQLEHVFDLEGLNVDDGHVELLPKLKVLWLFYLQKLRHICNCGSSRNHFPSSMASAPVGNIIFPKLSDIMLEYLPNLTSFVSPGYHSLQRLHHADLDTPFPVLFDERVAFPSLGGLDISNLDSVEKIWHNEFVADSFGKLKRLSVESCQKLRNVIPSNMLKGLPSLQILKIVDSNSLEEIFDLESIDSKETHDIPTLQLRKLCLDNLEKLKCVWNKAPQGLLTHPNLKSIQVSHCPSLIIPYQGYVVRSLLQVKVDMNSCGVKEIVSHEDIAKVVSMFFFPEVTSLTNSCLKQLECFYLGLHNLEWPMLKTLEVESHESLEKLASNLDKPVEQPIFLCDKLPFPNLEFLNLSLKLEEMQDLHVLFGALSKLKILIVENCPFILSLFSPQFIQCLNNLKKLTVKKCNLLEEVFDLKGLAHGDDELVEMLSKLEEVSLIDLPQLRDICNNSPPQVLCFQNLKSLQVKQCNSVTYLFSPSVVLGLVQLQDLHIEHCPALKEIFSMEGRDTDNWPPQVSCFQNLKSLQVKQCESLMYLFPYSVALGLGRLQDLYIEHCSKMKKIIMKDGDVDNRPQQVSSFQNLKFVRVKQCDSLMYLFSSSMALGLVQLQDLSIEDCPAMREIVTAEDRDFYNQPPLVSCFQNLKFVRVKQCDSLMYLFSSSMALGLVQLQDLSIEDCPAMREIVTAEDRDFYNQPPLVSCFQNLKSVQVKQCDSLMYLFSSFFALALAQLQYLWIEHCYTMKEIVTAEEGVRDEIIFPQITRVSLLKLPKLTTFYLSQTLEKIHMGDSNTAPGVLFNEEVAFPKLEILYVSGLDNVKKIWHNQLLADSLSKLNKMEVKICNELQNISTSNALNWLPSLEILEIDSCGKLREVFEQEVTNVQEDVTDTQLSQLVLNDLQQPLHTCNKVLGKYLCLKNLKVLKVHNCSSLKNIFSPCTTLDLVLEGMKEIIMQEGAEEVIDKIEFPELTSLSLQSLPSLASFYPGSHTLRRVGAGDHDILTTVLFNEKVAFPKLEILYVSGLDNVKKIWHNQLLADSFSKLNKMEVKICNELQNISTSNALNWLPSLEILEIDSCGKLREVFEQEVTNVQEDVTDTQLSQLVLNDLQQPLHTCNKVLGKYLCLQNLKVLKVHNCSSLKNIFSPCTALDLVLEGMKEIIMQEGAEEDIDKIEFPELTSLSLQSLPSLASFYPGSHTLRRVGPGDHDILTTVLFNEKVAFPKLEILYVSGLDNVKKIWHNQLLADSLSKLNKMEVKICNELQNISTSNALNWLPSLEILEIDSCGKLREVFEQEVTNVQEDVTDTQLSQLVLNDLQQPLHTCNKVLGKYLCLQNLKVLKVHNCSSLKNIFSPCTALDLVLGGMKEIIMQEGAEEVIDKIEFPELTSLSLQSLPSLASFYPGSHTLRRVGPGDHDILTTVLFNEKVAFPKLEILYVSGLDNVKKIWHNQLLADSFSKLNKMEVKICNELQNISTSNALNWLPSLEILEIDSCGKLREVFEQEVTNVQEDVTDTQLSQLVLNDLQQPLHTCNKVLGKYLCLQNLKVLKVHNCSSLKNIFSPCTALDLVLGGMKEIIMQEGAEEVIDKIEFPELTSLSLQSLPSLASFYPGSHTLRRVGPGDHDILTTVLFNEKVAFPKLEILYVSGLDNVKKIWHNQLLADSLSKLNKMEVKICNELQNISTSNALNWLPSLEILEIDSCGKLREVFEQEVTNVQEYVTDTQLSQLVLNDLQQPLHTCNKVLGKYLCLQNLKVLKVHNCSSLKNIFSPCTALDLVLEGMKEIIMQEGAEEVIDKIEFPELTSLSLQSLPSLASFYPGSHTLRRVGPGDHDILTTVLFNEKVAFPKLEILYVSGLDNVKKIWHNQLLADSFSKLNKMEVKICNELQNISTSNALNWLPSLEILEIDSCGKLREVFEQEVTNVQEDVTDTQLSQLVLNDLQQPLHTCNKVLGKYLCLQNLKVLKVHNCSSLKNIFSPCTALDLVLGGMKEIIMQEGAEEVIDKIEFPELTSLSLQSLPSLASFYPGSHTLRRVGPGDHDILTTVLFNEKVAFPKLEILYVSGLDNVKKIWHNQLLADSLSKLNKMEVKICNELQNISTSNALNWLPSLEILEIDSCGKLREVFEQEVTNVQEYVTDTQLSQLVLNDLQQPLHTCNKVLGKYLCLQNLKVLKVHNCSSLKNIFSPCTALDLVLEGMKEIIMQEGAEEVIDKIEFPELTSLSLQSLPSLASFYPGSHTLRRVGPGDHDILTTVLFNEKVAFPKLEILYVSGLDNVKKIWHNQLLADSLSKLNKMEVKICNELQNISTSNALNWLPSLEILEIDSCGKLREVFEQEVTNVQEDVTDTQLSQLVLNDLQQPLHTCNKVLGKYLCLQNLKVLKVHNCSSLKNIFSPCTALDLVLEGMKEIIMQEGAEEVIDKIEFPELTSLSLQSLPSLASFYPGSHTLRRVGPGDHDILTTVLFNEKVAFPKLEILYVSGLDNVKKIWHNQLLADSFSKLNKMEVKICNELQNISTSNALNWLPSLEILEIDSCGKLREVFEQEVTNVQEDVTDTQLSQLVLNDLQQPLHTCKKVLGKYLCLQNLKVLKVHNCSSLKNIFSPCTALDLVLEGMKEIIMQEGVEEVIDKIEFPELTSLSLQSLPSLASFYPGSHTLRRGGPGDHDILITVLFNEKVAFPSLVSLHISGLDNIEEIWNNKRTANSFSRLKEVEVEDCNKLQNGLPLFVLKWLSDLQFLRIAHCGKLKEVFDLEGADILDNETATQLNKLELHNLPLLQYIWNKDPYGILTIQILDFVEVVNCHGLKSHFPAGSIVRDLSQLEKQLIRSRWEKDLEGKNEGKDFVFPEVTYNELELPDLRKIKGKEVLKVHDYVSEISEDMPGNSG